MESDGRYEFETTPLQSTLLVEAAVSMNRFSHRLMLFCPRELPTLMEIFNIPSVVVTDQGRNLCRQSTICSSDGGLLGFQHLREKG